MLFRRTLPCQRRPLHMWEFNPEGPRTLQQFFSTTHEEIWKLLFKAQKSRNDRRYRSRLRSSSHPGKCLYSELTRFINQGGMLRLPSFNQGWTKKAERIKCPAPLPENPADPLLTRMLVPAPYQAPQKKAKKKGKEAKSGLRRKGTSDAMSREIEAPSSHEGDEDEEDEAESDSPLKGRKKKRAASVDPEAEASKWGKISLSDGSDSDAEAIPKRRPREKPLAESLVSKDALHTSYLLQIVG